jgi:hypothetical protein
MYNDGFWYGTVDDTYKIDDSDILVQPAKISHKSHTTKQLIKLCIFGYESSIEISENGVVSACLDQSANILRYIGVEIKSQTIGGKSKSISVLLKKTRDGLLV